MNKCKTVAELKRWSDAKVEFTLENIELESDGNGVFFIPHDKKTGGSGSNKKESKIWIF
jgi:hypothetical protein